MPGKLIRHSVGIFYFPCNGASPTHSWTVFLLLTFNLEFAP